MIRLITPDDFIETYTKLRQRGVSFILSKLNLNHIKRAKTAFNHLKIESANWWIIPKVKERWNLLITGDKDLEPEEYILENYLKNKKNLKMLSLGSGSCKSELKFASYGNFQEILCVDIAEKPMEMAKVKAKEKGLNNIIFKVQNANSFSYQEGYFDIVYFRSSLHHFKNVKSLVGDHLKKVLKKEGFLIIDEYVGPSRLQFPKHQIKIINEAIKLIPKNFRKRYKLSLYKNRFYGSGLIRMIVADPSECIESNKILPTIHKNYHTVYEIGYGGNIIPYALKDLAHHFINLDEEKEGILNKLFNFEDKYLATNPSDFVFGIYKLN